METQIQRGDLVTVHEGKKHWAVTVRKIIPNLGGDVAWCEWRDHHGDVVGSWFRLDDLKGV